MQGQTSRDVAGKLAAGNTFIANIGDREYVITTDVFVPITGETAPHVFAEPISPSHVSYASTRRASAEEEALLAKVAWASQ